MSQEDKEVRQMAVIGTMRVGSGVMVMPGAIILPCTDCGFDSWASPKSQQVLSEAKSLGLKVDLVCQVCAPERQKLAASVGEEFEGHTDVDAFLRAVISEQDPD